MAVKVEARPEVSTDLQDLPTNELRREALASIVEIREHPFRSQRLGKLPLTGDLSDCRKKFFDEARYRIVFRLLPDETKPLVADMIAVGPRAALWVYTAAVERLGRSAA